MRRLPVALFALALCAPTIHAADDEEKKSITYSKKKKKKKKRARAAVRHRQAPIPALPAGDWRWV